MFDDAEKLTEIDLEILSCVGMPLSAVSKKMKLPAADVLASLLRVAKVLQRRRRSIRGETALEEHARRSVDGVMAWIAEVTRSN